MLTGLTIRDFVLIEALDLEPTQGLTVLTGETGAGKSILLDALAAACGARSEAGLVRSGAEKASVTATFEPPAKHPARTLLTENEIEAAGPLMLRRVVGADGRSRAFINDQPVGVALLKQIGDLLLEVHGQFDTHGLLDPTTHGPALDRFASVSLTPIEKAYAAWHTARKTEAEARAALAKAEAQEAMLKEAVKDLKQLAPKAGEEAELAAQKTLLQNRDKVWTALQAALEALNGEQGAEATLAEATKTINKVHDQLGEKTAEVIRHLDIARDATAEAESVLEHLASTIEGNGLSLEQVEDRLYSLRAAARRHGVSADDLPELYENLQQQLSLISAGGMELDKLAAATRNAKAAYELAARELSSTRQKAAKKLEKAIMAELAPLKLDRAVFTVSITEQPEANWSAKGWDSITFTVATNPGAPAGPLNKIASGGELARFMLALKVVLADSTDATTLIFDEIDQGVGGAVAAAVGDRLARLAKDVQVLVVTHSPQVAAKAGTHWQVSKAVSGKTTRTSVGVLQDAARKEEIARMLSGATITDAARKTATELLAS